MNRTLFTLTFAAALASLSAFGCSDGASGTGVNGGSSGTSGTSGTSGSTTSGGTDNGTVGTGTPCAGEGIKVLGHCNAKKNEYNVVPGAEGDAIGNEMWTVMTGAQCWFKDGSSQQYVFYGSLQYTFWGIASDSKSGGTLGLVSVGRFEDKNASIVMLRGEQWLIVVLDSQTITLGKYINGQPYIELYKAHNEGRCT